MKLKIFWLTLICFLLSAIAVFAQGPLPEVDVSKATEGLVLGISTLNWVLICSGAGLIVIMLLRYLLLTKLTGKPLAIASCVLIAIGASATALLLSPTDWVEAIGAGISAGMIAGSAWDLIPDSWTKAFNKIVKAKDDKKVAKKNTGAVGANDDVIG